jgi:hydrogenase-1 operon protein HyaF
MSVEPSCGCTDESRTGLAGVLLHEIAILLDRLAVTREPASIDLRSLPMTDADRHELEAHLGRGEVSVELAIPGGSKIWETRYAGVWWVRHFGADENIVAEEIAVTRVPEILFADPSDIAAAATRFGNEFGAAQRIKEP